VLNQSGLAKVRAAGERSAGHDDSLLRAAWCAPILTECAMPASSRASIRSFAVLTKSETATRFSNIARGFRKIPACEGAAWGAIEKLSMPSKHDKIPGPSPPPGGGIPLVWGIDYRTPSIRRRSPSEAGINLLPPILTVRILCSQMNL
jgi:hypothetical protein